MKAAVAQIESHRVESRKRVRVRVKDARPGDIAAGDERGGGAVTEQRAGNQVGL